MKRKLPVNCCHLVAPWKEAVRNLLLNLNMILHVLVHQKLTVTVNCLRLIKVNCLTLSLSFNTTQFLLVLMKLHLNVDNELLSMLFNVHASTISCYLHKWIDVMYERLKPLVKWPDHEQLHKTMPTEFRKNNFSKCVAIFEFFIEQPKGLMARAQTWSNYKHHKFLIGISLQGSITFVSKGWGGRVSDQHFTEHCGILDHLLPGDLVLAERDSMCIGAAHLYCAEVELPHSPKAKSNSVIVKLTKHISFLMYGYM